MLHFLRQNKQTIGAPVLALLLMGWMTLACQNCFADSAVDAEHASHMHVAMECCSDGHLSAHGQTGLNDTVCQTKYLTNQPIVVATVADKTVMPSGDPILVLSSVTIHDSFLLSPDGHHNAGLDQEIYFSPRLFSSYRILLI